MPENKTSAPQPEDNKSQEQPPNSIPDEYDRRGIKLPARTLVGGIITPI